MNPSFFSYCYFLPFILFFHFIIPLIFLFPSPHSHYYSSYDYPSSLFITVCFLSLLSFLTLLIIIMFPLYLPPSYRFFFLLFCFFYHLLPYYLVSFFLFFSIFLIAFSLSFLPFSLFFSRYRQLPFLLFLIIICLLSLTYFSIHLYSPLSMSLHLYPPLSFLYPLPSTPVTM